MNGRPSCVLCLLLGSYDFVLTVSFDEVDDMFIIWPFACDLLCLFEVGQ